MPYDCGYGNLPNTRSSAQRNCQQVAATVDRGGLAPVAQKKHHMFGKRSFQEPMSGSPAVLPNGSHHNHHHHHHNQQHHQHHPPPHHHTHPHHHQPQHPSVVTSLKYDYEQAAAAGPPGQAYSGPIEGATGPQAEVKYSCSIDFARQHPHQSG